MPQYGLNWKRQKGGTRVAQPIMEQLSGMKTGNRKGREEIKGEMP
jgi:hypothetical protein